MGKISILDDHTANKIAAGEVVERPASVVKELVENSLDAGSSRIEVHVRGGGLDKITVTDNGEGMSGEDALLAFSRHATSKISGEADLDAISSLGFRGEALPSIAAVATVEMKTRLHDNVAGQYIFLEEGKVCSQGETGCPAGTTITVTGLFKNLPARLKSVKSPSVEIGHISDVMNKLAIAHPDVCFSLFHENKPLLRTAGQGDMLAIIAAIYGTETARSLLPVTGQAENMTVTGFIGKPSLSRSGRNHQVFIVNKRVIRNLQLSRSLEEAYHSLMMTGRHPVAFLKFEIPYDLVDPNVHPSKAEVRLYVPDQVARLTKEAVREALSRNDLIPESRFQQSVTITPSEKQEQFVQKTIRDQISLSSDTMPINQSVVERTPAQPVTEPEVPEKAKEAEIQPYTDACREDLAEFDSSSGPVTYPELIPLCQIDNTYIIARGDNGGFYMIDQHAAHERILYEKNMKTEAKTNIQILAVPDNIDLTHQEAQILVENILEFHKAGFIVEHFGGDSFLLRGVPQGFPPGSEKKIFLDLLDYFYHNLNKLTNKQLYEGILITMSCKAAIKAGDYLSRGQMEQLLLDLGRTDMPYTCPHGRPTTIHISGYELEKMFKRVT